MHRRGFLLRALSILGLAASASAAEAKRRGRRRDRYDRHRGEQDYDRARRAYEMGQIKSLLEVLNKVRMKYPGDVVDIDSQEKAGIWVYQIKVIDKGGRLLEIQVNATTKEIMRVLGE